MPVKSQDNYENNNFFKKHESIKLYTHQLELNCVEIFHRKTFYRSKFHRQDISQIGYFVDRTFCRQDFLQMGYFVDRTFCRQEFLQMGYFLDRTFINGIFRKQDFFHRQRRILIEIGNFISWKDQVIVYYSRFLGGRKKVTLSVMNEFNFSLSYSDNQKTIEQEDDIIPIRFKLCKKPRGGGVKLFPLPSLADYIIIS